MAFLGAMLALWRAFPCGEVVVGGGPRNPSCVVVSGKKVWRGKLLLLLGLLFGWDWGREK
jgi:hypothetical protein